jgi:hypothetical protein
MSEAPFPVSIPSARDVCQLLRDVTTGRRHMAKLGDQTWDEVYACHFLVNVDGWRISLYNDCTRLTTAKVLLVRMGNFGYSS